MPLNESFKTTSQGSNMRLSKMSSVPTPEDLAFALSLAVKNSKNVVELPWKSATSPVNYIIKVTCNMSLEEPRWILHVGGDDEQAVLWNYDTADASLIHSLITAECERSTYKSPHAEELTAFPAEVQLQAPAPGQDGNQAPSGATQWSGPDGNGSAKSVDPTASVQNMPVLPSGASPAPAPPEPEPARAEPPQRPLPPPIDLDRAAVDSIYKVITNAETGFISHAAFLFFLVGEFNRFQKDKKPLSVVRFEMCVRVGNSIQLLPPQAVKEAYRRFRSVLRPTDWAAHYEHEYALLLPQTNRAEAGKLIETICAAVASAPLIPGMEPHNVGVFCGVSCMPDDCTHPGVLLAAAQDAKTRARAQGKPVILFADAG